MAKPTVTSRKPRRKRPIITTAVPASRWPAWTDRPLVAVCSAIARADRAGTAVARG